MKKSVIVLCLCLIACHCFSQDKEEKRVGMFRHLANFKPGLHLGGYYNLRGENAYILQQNARVVEHEENKYGASLSIVILIPLTANERVNFLLNLPFLDYSGNTAENLKFFNSQTPFGVGVAFFPIRDAPNFGFSGMMNFGRQNRMRKHAIESQFFPIADYPNYELNVGAPVPEPILDSYMYKEFTLSANIGITVRL